MPSRVYSVKRLVALAAVHDDIVSVDRAEELFGKKTVEAAVSNGLVRKESGFLGEGLRDAARKKRVVSAKKLKTAKGLLSALADVPWVRFAAVTGSVCHGSALDGDDIDVFIVAAHNRVWLTRIVEQMIFRLRGVRRRYGDTDVSNRICVNFYTSDDQLDFSRAGRRDFMAALEIVSMKPVVHPDFYSVILQNNQWVREHFPETVLPERTDNEERDRKASVFFGDLLDWLCMKLSLAYMYLLGHPVGDVLVERNRIQFFDSSSWDRKEKEWRKLLELDDVS